MEFYYTVGILLIFIFCLVIMFKLGYITKELEGLTTLLKRKDDM